MKTFYLTTAIDYANGSPHLGHAYEKTLADAIARFERLQGKQVFFLTGLDEHGQKVQQSAKTENKSPTAFCNDNAKIFQTLCKNLNLSHDIFIRTSDEKHKAFVRKSLQQLFDAGYFYKENYTGFYSTRQEQFLQEKDKVEGKWPAIFGEVSKVSEPAYFFKLKEHQNWLIEWIQTNDTFIFPKFRKNQVLEFLKTPLNDLCISRPKARLEWGIALPFDENFVCYVWFDALLNYLSALEFPQNTHEGKCWPADLHIIGKDILAPSHSIYWPIMLKALGKELPKQILTHGFWQVEGEKMSKSLKNIVDPLELIEQVGTDSVRYFFLREMRVGQDSNFSIEQLLKRYHNELGNDLGNLLSRLLNMVERYCESKVSDASLIEALEKNLETEWQKTKQDYFKAWETYNCQAALDVIFSFVRATNRYTEERAPWQLAKSSNPKDKKRLETSLAVLSESLRLIGISLLPFIPQTAQEILDALDSSTPDAFEPWFNWDYSLLKNKTLGKKEFFSPVSKNNPHMHCSFYIEEN